MSRQVSLPSELTCPVCHGTAFEMLLSRTDGRMIQGAHTTTLMIRETCAHTMTFFGRV